MIHASPIVICVQGEATIRQADVLAVRLRQALTENQRVEVDCTDLVDVDLSFIQLLIATRRSAREAGKEFVVLAPTSGCLADAWASAGLQPLPVPAPQELDLPQRTGAE